MIENEAKEELIEMKEEPQQGGKTYWKSSRVHLGIGNSRLDIEVRLGVEMAWLSKPVINMKTPEDSSRVRLGIASLRLGKGPPPSADEKTCLCLGKAQFS